MAVRIIKKALLDSVPSGSGIEVVNGIIYIIGDDSEFLFGLNHELRILHKVELYKEKDKHKIGNRIDKKVKQDLENMASFDINGYPHLVIGGSGSRMPERAIGYLVKLPTPYNKKHLVWKVDMVELYELIKKHPEFDRTKELNIEATFVANDYFYLVNRASQQMMRYPLAEMVEYFQQHTESTPFPEFINLTMDPIDGEHYTLSGATTFKNDIYFTASCEKTKSAYLDGKIVGSVIAKLPIDQLPASGRTSLMTPSIHLEKVFPIYNDLGDNLQTKMESVHIYEQDVDGTVGGVAVADNDDGTSIIYLFEITPQV